jgi:molecular chaperone GrpE
MEKESGNRPVEGPEDTGSAPAPPATEKETPEPIDWETRYKYLLADFDNFRRRTERDRTAFRVEAEAGLLRRLLPLIEGFENAEASAKALPPADPLRRGLELLGRELHAFLRSMGFVPVARVGQPFRPDEHEAVGETTASKDAGDGEVAEIVQQGYRFQGGLLRPAKVLVARAVKSRETPAGPPSEPGERNSADSPVEEDSA